MLWTKGGNSAAYAAARCCWCAAQRGNQNLYYVTALAQLLLAISAISAMLQLLLVNYFVMSNNSLS